MTEPIVSQVACPKCAWAMEETAISPLLALAQTMDLEDRLREHTKTAHPDTERS